MNEFPGARPLVLLQDELAGATDPARGFAAAGCEVWRFSAVEMSDWRDRLRALDDAFATCRPAIGFVSINVADFIRMSCPALNLTLAYRPQELRHHVWSALVPLELQFNRSFVLLPFGHLAASAERLRRLYGDHLFLRPDSPRKVFAGLGCATADLAETASMLRQAHAVSDDSLVVVDRAQPVAGHEYRFWIARGAPVAHAAYIFGAQGVDPDRPAPPCPAPIHALAGDLLRKAPLLETIDDLLVADFILDAEGEPRLVEINAWSTSGFYPGVDFDAIARASTEMSWA